MELTRSMRDGARASGGDEWLGPGCWCWCLLDAKREETAMVPITRLRRTKRDAGVIQLATAANMVATATLFVFLALLMFFCGYRNRGMETPKKRDAKFGVSL